MRSKNFRKVNILFIGCTFTKTTLNDIIKINKRIGARARAKKNETDEDEDEGNRIYLVSKGRLRLPFTFSYGSVRKV